MVKFSKKEIDEWIKKFKIILEKKKKEDKEGYELIKEDADIALDYIEGLKNVDADIISLVKYTDKFIKERNIDPSRMIEIIQYLIKNPFIKNLLISAIYQKHKKNLSYIG